MGINNEKLIGRLSVDLSTFRTQIADVNKTLATLGMQKLSIGSIDDKTVKDMINKINSVKTEIESISKTSINTSGIKGMLDGLLKPLNDIQVNAKQTGDAFGDTIRKITQYNKEYTNKEFDFFNKKGLKVTKALLWLTLILIILAAFGIL